MKGESTHHWSTVIDGCSLLHNYLAALNNGREFLIKGDALWGDYEFL